MTSVDNYIKHKWSGIKLEQRIYDDKFISAIMSYDNGKINFFRKDRGQQKDIHARFHRRRSYNIIINFEIRIIRCSIISKTIDGLPCSGPFFLYFTSLETQQYFGKVLISVQTELVPSEIENTKTLNIDGMLHNEVTIDLIL